MGHLLLLLLFFTILLAPAAAATPPMEPASFPSPYGSFYPDPDGLLAGVYNICADCGFTTNFCICQQPPQLFRLLQNDAPVQQSTPQFTAETFLNHPEWPGNQTNQQEQNQYPPPAPEPPNNPQHINSATVQTLHDNPATPLQSVPYWLQEVPTAGDRLEAPASTSSRRPSPKRQPQKLKGYPCDFTDCQKKFDRQSDLTRHQKNHLNPNSRPHKCLHCDKTFLYPKDCKRHQTRHKELVPIHKILYCRVDGCSNTSGFPRKDNLKRHLEKQHKFDKPTVEFHLQLALRFPHSSH